MDCLPHDLMIAKFHVDGLDILSLILMYSLLSNRKQRVNVNDTFSSSSKIHFGVLQGPILGLLLFNIFICDLFLFVSDCNAPNYTNVKTLYSAKKSC